MHVLLDEFTYHERGSIMDLKLTNIVNGGGLSTEAAPVMTKLGSDSVVLASTREVLGMEVQGPGKNVTVTVEFTRRNGKIRFYQAANGARYCWANIKLSEIPTIETVRSISSTLRMKESVDITIEDGVVSPVADPLVNFRIDHDEYTHDELSWLIADQADRITKGNVVLDKDGNFVFEGFRVFVYDHEEGPQISTAVPSKKNKKNKWVNKYTGFAGWMAKRLIPAIEYAFILETKLEIVRPFAATCDQCMQCITQSYGQNEVEPNVSCGLGLQDDVMFSFSWEADKEHGHVSVFGNSVYLKYSEEVDDITCLPSSKYHMDSRTASNRGRVGYELPSWFSSTERANEVILSLYKALYLDMHKLYGDSALAGLRTMWRDEHTKWDFELPGLLFDEEDLSLSAQMGRFGDISEPGCLGTLGMSEKDVLPEMERVLELTANLHPLVARLLLEGSFDRDTAEMFPNLRAALQEAVLAEPNPRMKRVGSVTDYLREEAYSGESGCLWFAYRGSRKPAYGAPAFHAREALSV